MKLRATVTRKEDRRTKSFKAIFPVGVTPVIDENILRRNLGPRPYCEIYFTDNGKQVRIWVK